MSTRTVANVEYVLPVIQTYSHVEISRGILQREALDLAPKAYLKSLRRSPTPSSSSSSSQEDLAEPQTPETPSRDRRLSLSSIVSAVSVKSAFSNLLKPSSPKLSSSPSDPTYRQPEVGSRGTYSFRRVLIPGRTAFRSFAGSRTA